MIAVHDIEQCQVNGASIRTKIQNRMRLVSNDAHPNDGECTCAFEIRQRFHELPQGLRAAFGCEGFRICILVSDEVEQMDASVLETSNMRLWRASEDQGDTAWTLIHDSMNA